MRKILQVLNLNSRPPTYKTATRKHTNMVEQKIF